MTIVVNTHSQQEELELLAFLDRMKYEYVKEEGSIILSEEQQREILERDRKFEAGETKSYSFDEILTHFNLKDK
jgi:hypothetical protein